MQPKSWVKVFWSNLSATSNKQASVQAWIIKKVEIYNVFHMSLLEQNILRKEQVNNENSKKYKIEVIYGSIIYTKKSKSG